MSNNCTHKPLLISVQPSHTAYPLRKSCVHSCTQNVKYCLQNVQYYPYIITQDSSTKAQGPSHFITYTQPATKQNKIAKYKHIQATSILVKFIQPLHWPGLCPRLKNQLAHLQHIRAVYYFTDCLIFINLSIYHNLPSRPTCHVAGTRVLTYTGVSSNCCR